MLRTCPVASRRNGVTRLQLVLAGLPDRWERLGAALGVVLAQAWSAACSTATSTFGATSDPAVDTSGWC